MTIYENFNNILRLNSPKIDRNWISKVIEDTSEYYRIICVPKSNGNMRTISVPEYPLKFVQKRTLSFLNKEFKPHISAHGFAKKKSIKSNAINHIDKRYILTFDIKDYFEAISQQQVYLSLLKHIGRNVNIELKYPDFHPNTHENWKKFLWTVSMLCTIKSGTKRYLPTGGPSSPILSNIVFYKHDVALEKLARKYNCTYSRYADDITISSNNATDNSIKSLFHKASEYLQTNEFRINQQKTRLMPWYTHQKVNALTVQKMSVNVPKKYKKHIENKINTLKRYKFKNAKELTRKIEGIRYTLVKKGLMSSDQDLKSFLLQLNGQINYVFSIQPDSISLQRHKAFIGMFLKTYNLLLLSNNNRD